jgi:hypothetical protein
LRFGRFIHILQYLHLSNKDSAVNKNDWNYDRLWKVRPVSDLLNDASPIHQGLLLHLFCTRENK